MDSSITSTVVRALPSPDVIATDTRRGEAGIDLGELKDELEHVAIEALDARMRGVALDEAVHDARLAHLVAFHEGLRDAVLIEIPRELQPWIAAIGGESVERAMPGARSRPVTPRQADLQA